jgi:hypothetical protein
MSEYLPRINFQALIQDIVDEFGANKFSQRKVQLIYEQVKTLKINQFKRVCDEILMQGGYAPTPIKFRQIAEPFIVQNRNEQKNKESKEFKSMFTPEQLGQISKGLMQGLNGNVKALDSIKTGLSRLNQSKCKHCNDIGLVFATSKIRPYMADRVFNCFCEKGKKENNPNYPTWGKRYLDELENKNLRSA